MFVYMFFFLIITIALILLSNDLTKVIVSLTNIILVLTPLVGILFGTMYFYSSREFIQLLLAQPVSRRSIFSGMYLGLAASFSLSLVLGICVPLIVKGVLFSPNLTVFLVLCGMSVVLSVIFSLLAFIIALKFDNKIKGFGVAIFLWLFFAIIYDGIFLLLLLLFKEYPEENLTLGLIAWNPIDLSRILILLKLDVSTMMGYTGAVLQKFLGSGLGSLVILGTLFLWMAIPFTFMLRTAKNKDF